MADTGPRENAWARLHDPSTDASSLAAIAQEYPEFADAVSRHPNCYPELRAWLVEFAGAAAESPASGASASGASAFAGSAAPDSVAVESAGPEAATTVLTRQRRRPRAIVVGAVAAGAVLVAGGAVWAASALTSGNAGDESASASSAQSSADPAALGPRRLAGEPVYIGDELEWFLPDDEELRGFFPGAGDVKRGAEIGGIGESEGVNTVPAECVGWVLTDSYAFVGARAANGAGVSVRALQFPTPAIAADYYRSFAETVAPCAQFEIRSGDQAYATHTLTTVAETPAGIAVRAIETGDYGGETVEVYVLEGNVVLWATAFTPIEDTVAAEWLTSLTDRATQARAELTEQIGYR